MFFRYAVFILLFVFSIAEVSAGVNLEGTDEEKPVFAFFRMAERFPDFDYWAKSITKIDPKTAKGDDEILYKRTHSRLKWGHGAYNEKKDFLKIHTPVELSLIEKGGGYTINYHLTDVVSQEHIFFTYPYGSQMIAVFPVDINRFKALPVAPENYKRFQKAFAGNLKLNATLKLRIRPLESDISKPVKVNKVNHWMLSGDTAYFAYEIDNESGEKEILMEYTAPWYLSDSEEELLDLLGQ